MTKISTANLETLQAMIAAAKTTGEISVKDLVGIGELIGRESVMKGYADYLATKTLLPVDRARVKKLMKIATHSNVNKLRKVVELYKVRDVPLMIDALDNVTLTRKDSETVAAIQDKIRRNWLRGHHFDMLAKLLREYRVEAVLDTSNIPPAPAPRFQDEDGERICLGQWFPIPH